MFPLGMEKGQKVLQISGSDNDESAIQNVCFQLLITGIKLQLVLNPSDVLVQESRFVFNSINNACFISGGFYVERFSPIDCLP